MDLEVWGNRGRTGARAHSKDLAFLWEGNPFRPPEDGQTDTPETEAREINGKGRKEAREEEGGREGRNSDHGLLPKQKALFTQPWGVRRGPHAPGRCSQTELCPCFVGCKKNLKVFSFANCFFFFFLINV